MYKKEYVNIGCSHFLLTARSIVNYKLKKDLKSYHYKNVGTLLSVKLFSP